MIKKHYYKLLIFMTISQIAFSQSTSDFFVQLGFNYNNFQDVKYSNVIYNGPGVQLNLGYLRDGAQSIIGAGLSANGGVEFAGTHDNGATNALYPRIYAKYQRKINKDLALGLHWDILSLYYRKVNGLMNNGNYYQTASDLLLSGSLQKGKFHFGLDVGVLSLIKEGAGFAFTAPQSALENGEFDYQNEGLANPLSLSTGDWRTINKRQVIMTTAEWQPNSRIGLGYTWELRRITSVPDHAATTGRHTVSFRYNFVHRERQQKAGL